jgi:hypothetical protein
VPVNLPIFYSRPDESVTLNANEPRGDITMFCRTRRSHKLSDKIMVPPRVDELIRAMATPPLKGDDRTFRGIGLHYSLIVQVLDDLCKNGSISARFVMEQTPLADILGPTPPGDRPERKTTSPRPRPRQTPSHGTKTTNTAPKSRHCCPAAAEPTKRRQPTRRRSPTTRRSRPSRNPRIGPNEPPLARCE